MLLDFDADTPAVCAAIVGRAQGSIGSPVRPAHATRSTQSLATTYPCSRKRANGTLPDTRAQRWPRSAPRESSRGFARLNFPRRSGTGSRCVAPPPPHPASRRNSLPHPRTAGAGDACRLHPADLARLARHNRRLPHREHLDDGAAPWQERRNDLDVVQPMRSSREWSVRAVGHLEG